MLELEQIESFYPEKLRVFKKNILREYLQYKILEIIFNSKYSYKFTFMGGTALRIIYENSRFSEDLDFDNLGLIYEDFVKLANIIKNKLMLEGYYPEITTRKRGAFIASIKIKNLLYDLKLSSHPDQKLLMEIDAEAQDFKYKPDKKLINKFDIFTTVFVVPINILFSQKILAILKRPRTMGRDLFDFVFLAGRTKPDMQYLIEKAGMDNIKKIKESLIYKVNKMDLKKSIEDIGPFIMDKKDLLRIEEFSSFVKNLKI